MYPHPPPSNRPTNYYWILLGCVAVMLLLMLVAFRSFHARFNQALAVAPAVEPAPTRVTLTQASLAAQVTATPAVAPSAEATADASGVVDVDAKTLTDSPGSYRSRVVRVRGTVFYTGKLEGGKTWIQIVDENNVYVDGQTSGTLPVSVAKGAQVELTGISAGLTSVTATNGKDYDQAYIDPIQDVQIVAGTARANLAPAASGT